MVKKEKKLHHRSASITLMEMMNRGKIQEINRFRFQLNSGLTVSVVVPIQLTGQSPHLRMALGGDEESYKV
jgi:hypothetical protein